MPGKSLQDLTVDWGIFIIKLFRSGCGVMRIKCTQENVSMYIHATLRNIG